MVRGKNPKGDESIRVKWDSSCEMAFVKLKQMLTDAPVLGFPDFSRGFILETDASFSSLGAVLSQQQESGLVVLGYASRALKPCERNMQNYSSMKLELLALYWAAELAKFTFTTKYRSGRSNRNGDALSRKASHGEEPPVARLEGMSSAPSHVLDVGAGTLVPDYVTVCAEEAMAGPLLQESHVRSPSMVPQGMQPSCLYQVGIWLPCRGGMK